MKKDKEIEKRNVFCKKTWNKIVVLAIVAMFVGSGFSGIAMISNVKDSSINNYNSEKDKEIIIGYNEMLPLQEIKNRIKNLSGEILEIHTAVKWILVRVSRDVNTFMEKIEGEEWTRYVELNEGMFHITYIPNDPYWDDQWGPQSINCPDAWDIEQGNSDIIVSIIDSGVDYTHEDLADNYIPGGIRLGG